MHAQKTYSKHQNEIKDASQNASALLEEAKMDRGNEHTITENNIIYEYYPYQLKLDNFNLH